MGISFFLERRGIAFKFPNQSFPGQTHNSEVRVTAVTEAVETAKVCELISILTDCSLVKANDVALATVETTASQS